MILYKKKKRILALNHINTILSKNKAKVKKGLFFRLTSEVTEEPEKEILLLPLLSPSEGSRGEWKGREKQVKAAVTCILQRKTTCSLRYLPFPPVEEPPAVASYGDQGKGAPSRKLSSVSQHLKGKEEEVCFEEAKEKKRGGRGQALPLRSKEGVFRREHPSYGALSLPFFPLRGKREREDPFLKGVGKLKAKKRNLPTSFPSLREEEPSGEAEPFLSLPVLPFPLVLRQGGKEGVAPQERGVLRRSKGDPSYEFKIAVKNRLIPTEYSLETFHRSNQDTCLLHNPAVFEGDWVQSGDLLADCAASSGGELSLGKNILVAYMPWEGYNFEDAILISERLVFEDVYSSIHIERYDIEIRETKYGMETITREIPELSKKELEHLDLNGIAKLGSWIQEGDILVGRVTPINKTIQSNYKNLLYTILEAKPESIRDSSLRAPRGMKGKIVNVQRFSDSGKTEEVSLLTIKELKTKKDLLSNSPLLAHFPSDPKENRKKKHSLFYSCSSSKNPSPRGNGILRKGRRSRSSSSSASLPFPSGSFASSPFEEPFPPTGGEVASYGEQGEGVLRRGEKGVSSPTLTQRVRLASSKHTSLSSPLPSAGKEVGGNGRSNLSPLRSLPLRRTPFPLGEGGKVLQRERKRKEAREGKGRPFLKTKKPINLVYVYLAEKRKIQVGDKMAGRHGNKGIVSQVLPRQDMPFLANGTPIDMVLNPLGVPSRMNVGQIYECLLGLAAQYLGEHYKIFPFDEKFGSEASRSFVYSKLYEARKKTGSDWLFDPNCPGKTRLFDGRTGDPFDQTVTVGYAYMLKLVHLVDDKIHMRSTGPYSLVTQQPLRGRSKQGGQRLGEMEVWALEGYGAAFTLLEMLTLKSDDMTGRMTLWSNLILNKDLSIGTPESFKVLVCELQALCLDIGIFRADSAGNLTEIESLKELP